MNAGFRPMESSRDPTAGETKISVSAAHDAMMDKVDVARSDPISAMRARAGENETKAWDTIYKKDDSRKIDKSLGVQDAAADDDDDDGVDDEAGDDNVVADLSFFEEPPLFSLLFECADCCFFLFCIVDPPLKKIDRLGGFVLNCAR